MFSYKPDITSLNAGCLKYSFMAHDETKVWEKKSYLKVLLLDNVNETQKQIRKVFQTTLPAQLTIVRIMDTFEADRTVQNIHRHHSRNTTGTHESPK